jgi:hypothetical protein
MVQKRITANLITANLIEANITIIARINLVNEIAKGIGEKQ